MIDRFTDGRNPRTLKAGIVQRSEISELNKNASIFNHRPHQGSRSVTSYIVNQLNLNRSSAILLNSLATGESGRLVDQKKNACIFKSESNGIATHSGMNCLGSNQLPITDTPKPLATSPRMPLVVLISYFRSLAIPCCKKSSSNSN